MDFYVGLHQPSDARHFERCFISVNRLRERKSDFEVKDWIMDSGAFTEISKHGKYREDVPAYARQINRWASCGRMVAAVAQDYMCEPWIVQRTGLTVLEHQKRTIQRYMALLACTPHYVMPVIQGFTVADYLRHLEMYRGLLQPGMMVGVGSVCKRQTDPLVIQLILESILRERPGLRLHGFGVKTTALKSRPIRKLLGTADSMAWSDSARKQSNIMRRALEKELGVKLGVAEARAILAERGIKMRNANDWHEAKEFEMTINGLEASERECWRAGDLWSAEEAA